jgi:N-acetylmuramate 1-kinase
MVEQPLIAFLADEEDTSRLARVLAPRLRAGDTILLEGPIGAGKSHLCRAIIRSRLGRDEEVPSPTFTLVQTYEDDPDIWHADLYRLTHPDEARELGLEEAFETAICLVEWPDRLGRYVPLGAIRIRLSIHGTGRMAEIDTCQRAGLAAALVAEFPDSARDAACRILLERAGWAGAERKRLAGDASARSYERLGLNGQSRILMNSPPGLADDVSSFVRVDDHLRHLGLSAPIIYTADLERGFLLMEDLGDGAFAPLIGKNPAMEPELCRAAIDVLLHLQSNPPAADLPDLSAQEWTDSAGLVLDWYRFAITGEKARGVAFRQVLSDLLKTWADRPRVMILRDYHAENLMWLPEREGLAKVGLLDFQLAQMGQPGYDLVSLLQDARRDVSPAMERSMVQHFVEAKGLTEGAFAPAYAALGALRALRILGIFARLCLVEGKSGYVAMIPRVWGHLRHNLAQPELSALRQICDALIPPPTSQNLKRIEGQCSAFR